MIIYYVKDPEAYIAKKVGNKIHSSGSIPMLLGARIHADLTSENNGWVSVTDVPNSKGDYNAGFMELSKLSTKQQLKVFYLDVGQGDATLIEAENAMVIIDGGPNSGLHKYLKKRLKSLQKADESVGLPQRDHLFIDAIFVSHFDDDHYQGLKNILKDVNYKIGTIYHNGIARYGVSGDKDLDLGTLVKHTDGTRSISTDFTDIDSAKELINSGGLQTDSGGDNHFKDFLNALVDAHEAIDSRVDKVRRLVARKPSTTKVIKIGDDLEFDVLGPVTTKPTGEIRLPAFPNPHKGKSPSKSHTINGNSIVLRLRYKNNKFLFGGDLNQPAQKYLHDKYDNHLNGFQSEVNKACHHGSSDFDVEFLKDVEPMATIFSSGDDGNYDHPLPDAMGAAAKHSQGEFPLVFSTELARDTSVGGVIKYGHINARSNGDVIVMAQKKEKRGRSKRIWHTFNVPYKGPFGSH
jgi:beta-lactamase superfamily II metal-dependent hydrolase